MERLERLVYNTHTHTQPYKILRMHPCVQWQGNLGPESLSLFLSHHCEPSILTGFDAEKKNSKGLHWTKRVMHENMSQESDGCSRMAYSFIHASVTLDMRIMQKDMERMCSEYVWVPLLMSISCVTWLSTKAFISAHASYPSWDYWITWKCL